MDKGGVIYKITNKVNGKIYIGQTVREIQARWRVHKHCAKRGHGGAIYNAMRKYGISNFEISVVCSANSVEELNQLEKLCVAEYNSLAPNGYNLRTGGDRYEYTDESRKKMSESHKGKPNGRKKGVDFLSPEAREKARQKSIGRIPWNFGKHMPEEYCKKLSESRKGQVGHFKGKRLSEEHIQKLRDAWKRRKPVSDETKKKLSTVLKGKNLGKHHTEETKQILRIASTGNKNSLGYHPTEEQRKNMSIAHVGKKDSDETRKRKTEAQKKRWAERKAMGLGHLGKLNEVKTETIDGLF